MAHIKIDATELDSILRQTPAAQNVMLVGRHGIGKSQIVTAHFASRGMKVVPFFLGQMSDPGDLIGLLHKDEKTGRSVFLPPAWWPEDDEPIVLFLDELNRARPEILQTVMDLVLNKTLAGKRLPEGSLVVSAVNEGDEYQLTELDPALVSRFNIYEFSPTLEDWLVWAAASEIDPRVTAFIRENPLFLDSDPKAEAQKAEMPFGGDLTKTPDRRAWEKVARMIGPIDEIELNEHAKLIAGIVGSTAALAFVKSVQSRPSVTADDVLFRFAGTKDRLKNLALPDFAGLNEQILLRLQSGKELTAAQTKTALGNLASFLGLLESDGHSEALAHLANLLENERYDVASGLLMAETEIRDRMTEFIDAISIE
ncbi:MAG: AAA domain-containing protein [Verrucomicrobiales bacterium]|nr:AAA domain-containing protein [Verrucomicrobiales bacterium]